MSRNKPQSENLNEADQMKSIAFFLFDERTFIDSWWTCSYLVPNCADESWEMNCGDGRIVPTVPLGVFIPVEVLVGLFRHGNEPWSATFRYRYCDYNDPTGRNDVSHATNIASDCKGVVDALRADITENVKNGWRQVPDKWRLGAPLHLLVQAQGIQALKALEQIGMAVTPVDLDEDSEDGVKDFTPRLAVATR